MEHTVKIQSLHSTNTDEVEDEVNLIWRWNSVGGTQHITVKQGVFWIKTKAWLTLQDFINVEMWHN